MKKLLSYILVLALSLPLMAQETQEVEVIKKDGKTTVKVDGKEVKDGKVKIVRQHQKGDWNRGDMKRGDMAKRKEMRKKRFWRSVVRVVVIGGVAYYIGYTQGQKNNHKHKHGWNKPMPRGEK